MNWNAVGAIGEVFGAIAVFVTLAYLAVQVRHAREEVRRSASRAHSEARRDALAVQSDVRVVPLLLKAATAEGLPDGPFTEYAMTHYDMTREEAAILSIALLSTWYTRLQNIGAVDELSPPERQVFELELRAFYGRPTAERRFYELMLKPVAHPDTVRYIDSVLAQPYGASGLALSPSTQEGMR